METGTPKKPLNRQEILQLVRKDLAKVERDLLGLGGSSLPLVRKINQHLHSSGGKRLRPAVLLLCAKACHYSGPGSITLGAVVELIHVATLVHDDVIDRSLIRRGRASANAKWGNEVTVLAGDWLYMTSFQLALQLRNFRILDILIDVTRTMVEGELLQLEHNWNLEVSAEDHLEICSRKTACLFSSCARLAGVLAEVDSSREEQLAEYGRCLGLAFQLTDDLLDYTSDQETLGKPVLKDLKEGKITLPVIYLLQRANSEEREFLQSVVGERNFSQQNKNRIITLVHKHEALTSLQELANQFARKAVACCAHLPDSIYRDALLSIPEFIMHRET